MMMVLIHSPHRPTVRTPQAPSPSPCRHPPAPAPPQAMPPMAKGQIAVTGDGDPASSQAKNAARRRGSQSTLRRGPHSPPFQKIAFSSVTTKAAGGEFPGNRIAMSSGNRLIPNRSRIPNLARPSPSPRRSRAESSRIPSSWRP
jgi:hypothetical protein